MVGSDGGVKGFFEIRSMEVLCRAEGGSRKQDYRPGTVLRVWRGAARERQGLFYRPYECLQSTRTVRSIGPKFVAEAGYQIAESGNKGSKATATDESGNDGQGPKASDAMQ